MADELIDFCDESNNITLTKKMKSEAHKYGLWHRAAHIWIYNSTGEILLQLRAKEKSLYPGMWDISVAGHVKAGEDPIDAGLREAKEEIGLKIKKSDLQFSNIKKVKTIFRDRKENEFYYIYFLKFDSDIKKLKLQAKEVQEIKFFSTDKIKKELKISSNKYTPRGDYWLEIINAVKTIIS